MLALALSFALSFAALLAAPLDQHWSFKVAQAAQVEVANVNGSIRVEAAEGGEVSVRATSPDAGHFVAQVRQRGDHVSAKVRCDRHAARAKEASRDHDSDGDDDDDDEGENNGGSCRGGRIDLVLRVPAGAVLHASNVSGRIEVAGVRGEQSLSGVSGAITVEGSEGALDITVVSGKVRLAPQRLGETSVHSVSGDVELVLLRGAAADVSLHTLSGSIEGLGESGDGERRGRHGSKHRQLGSGGPEVSVESVSGSVRLSER